MYFIIQYHFYQVTGSSNFELWPDSTCGAPVPRRNLLGTTVDVNNKKPIFTDKAVSVISHVLVGRYQGGGVVIGGDTWCHVFGESDIYHRDIM